jgi:hypothetical protein
MQPRPRPRLECLEDRSLPAPLVSETLAVGNSGTLPDVRATVSLPTFSVSAAVGQAASAVAPAGSTLTVGTTAAELSGVGQSSAAVAATTTAFSPSNVLAAALSPSKDAATPPVANPGEPAAGSVGVAAARTSAPVGSSESGLGGSLAAPSAGANAAEPPALAAHASATPAGNTLALAASVRAASPAQAGGDEDELEACDLDLPSAGSPTPEQALPDADVAEAGPPADRGRPAVLSQAGAPLAPVAAWLAEGPADRADRPAGEGELAGQDGSPPPSLVTEGGTDPASGEAQPGEGEWRWLLVAGSALLAVYGAARPDDRAGQRGRSLLPASK